MDKRAQIKKVEYQINSAEQIYKALFIDDQNRYLLADEAGLGKTVTAANVIIKLYNERKKQLKSPVRICYICANMALAGENIKKLYETIENNTEYEKMTDGIFIIKKKSAERLPLAFREINNNDNNSVGLSIQAITPATSLKVQSDGTLEERSYAYSLLVGPEGQAPFLEKVCQGRVENEWDVYKEIEKARKTLYTYEGEYNDFCMNFCEMFHDIFDHQCSLLIKSVIEDMLRIVVFNKENNLKSLYILEEVTKCNVYTGNQQNTIKEKIRKLEKHLPLDKTRLKEIKREASQFVDSEEKIEIIKGLADDLDKDISKGNYFQQYKNKIIDFFAKESKYYYLIACLEKIKSTYGELAKCEKRFINACILNCRKMDKQYSSENQKKYNCDTNDLLNEIRNDIETLLSGIVCEKVFKIARMSMAVASLRQLKVDLFIADEIQNYSEIFVSGCMCNDITEISNVNAENRTETELVIQEVLFKENCKVLMLSATPFRYRTKLIELENRDKDVNCDSELLPRQSGEISKQENFLKEETDIYEEFKKIITYLKQDFKFRKWNCLCNNKNKYVCDNDVEKVKKIVKLQCKMLQKANISRVERYMSGIEMGYKNDNTLINWEDIGLDELMCIPKLYSDIHKTYNKDDFFDLCKNKMGTLIVYDSNLFVYDQKEFCFLSDDIWSWIQDEYSILYDDLEEELWDDAERELDIEEEGGMHFCNSMEKKESNYHLNELKRRLDSKIRMAYLKEVPACMSFKKDYEELRYIKDMSGNFTLSLEQIQNFKELELQNVRLKRLFKKIFGEGCHKLLFIPPVHSSRELGGVFAGTEGISKRLFFTNYNMTTKSLSTLLSYEANRRVCEDLKKKIEQNKLPEKIAVDKKDEIFLVIKELLNYDVDMKKLFVETRQIKSLGENESKTKEITSSIIVEKLYEYDTNCYNQSDNEKSTIYKYASPYNYAQKLECRKKFCMSYYRLMSDVDALRVLLAYCDFEDDNEKTLFDYILQYGYDGCIYDVFDEWIEVEKGEEGFVKKIDERSSITFAKIEALCINKSNNLLQSVKMETGFAIGHYAGDELSNVEKAKTLERKIAAFNTPFRPFQFISTSIGQEGFDFDKYCRIVVHWSLVFDPVKFEQREGRINRHRSYANRLNAFEWFNWLKSIDCIADENFSWENVYKILEENEQKIIDVEDSMGLFPDFIVPYYKNEKGEYQYQLERETYYYEDSYEAYKLKDVLLGVGYYRSLLGQFGEDTFEDSFKKFVERNNENRENFFIDLRPKKIKKDD